MADHQDNGLTVTASRSPEQAHTLLEVTLTNPTEDRIKGVDGWTLYALDDDDVVIGIGSMKLAAEFLDLAPGEQTTVERVVGRIVDCISKGSYLQADRVRLAYWQTVSAPGPEVAEGAAAVSTP
ncbi:hypothetical protein D1871_12750 [Nakamurella silvestris]|nr:hypothetical protein D1871_12750 [Nakamurella silvestris]